MIGIVIVAHGGLATEYLAAVEHVVGRQPGVRAITILPEDDRAAKQREICDAADAVDEGDGVVVHQLGSDDDTPPFGLAIPQDDEQREAR